MRGFYQVLWMILESGHVVGASQNRLSDYQNGTEGAILISKILTTLSVN